MTHPSDERGQSLVEFALVVPLLITIILVIIEVGNFYGQYQTVIDATTAAARFESICRTATSGSAAAIGQAQAGTLSNLQFTFTNSDGTAATSGAGCSVPSGNKVTVTGTATGVQVNLVFYSITFPVTSTVTVIEE